MIYRQVGCKEQFVLPLGAETITTDKCCANFPAKEMKEVVGICFHTRGLRGILVAYGSKTV